ncbi:hypothetical protein HJC23_001437 [Cyclotella cryptica]|uniref:GOLD domain-containing protein n=1 Tax=Cyclotella cryptica TaxID=29204 RepID=A0ABD3NYW1_9STRA
MHVTATISPPLSASPPCQPPPQKQQECIYDHFQPQDQVTFSVFLADALRSRPQITVSYEGPVAGHDEEHTDQWVDPRYPTGGGLGRKLQQSLNKHWPVIRDIDKLQRNPELRLGVLNQLFRVDWTYAGETEDARVAREGVQKQNHENYQKFVESWKEQERLEKEGRVDMKKAPNLPVHTVAMSSVESFEQTVPILAEGWYRLCVNGVESTPVLVEMDMRSANFFKGIDPDTGHVFTFAKRRMVDEAALLEGGATGEDAHADVLDKEEQAKIIEDQVRENDLKRSKEHLKELMELTSIMSQQQQAHMARIRSHGGSARRNHDNLVWSSKMETLLYAIITGWQVYTLRKWLLGDSILGK